MRLRLQFESLKSTTLAEYAERFLFGGAVTVGAALIDHKWGPVIGGLFLAFPGIFVSSAGLVEKHKVKREQEQGKQGVRLGRAEASVEATGASLGALGLAGFAATLWWLLPRHAPAIALVLAFVAWAVVGGVGWMIRERL